MILQLVNSKGRVVFAAQDDGNVDHESGGGWINKPEECFLSAACTLADNPSCEVSGCATTLSGIGRGQRRLR